MVNRTATQLVIWDWNGTLLDDAALCCDIANTMREERGMPPLDGRLPAGVPFSDHRLLPGDGVYV